MTVTGQDVAVALTAMWAAGAFTTALLAAEVAARRQRVTAGEARAPTELSPDVVQALRLAGEAPELEVRTPFVPEVRQ